ncbi:hypothetical protein A2335_01195 [Candidatus Peregrinibacteria bacterium RIFOXYB2_FULL_32_7]|nr:MAG: hypothetical protein A2335_01195 [Candidatus Peregrinibacteria bacterium RIFOXYB2_FULL_32_7]
MNKEISVLKIGILMSLLMSFGFLSSLFSVSETRGNSFQANILQTLNVQKEQIVDETQETKFLLPQTEIIKRAENQKLTSPTSFWQGTENEEDYDVEGEFLQFQKYIEDRIFEDVNILRSRNEITFIDKV